MSSAAPRAGQPDDLPKWGDDLPTVTQAHPQVVLGTEKIDLRENRGVPQALDSTKAVLNFRVAPRNAVLILRAAPNAVVPMDVDLEVVVQKGKAPIDARQNSGAAQMLRTVRKGAVLISGVDLKGVVLNSVADQMLRAVRKDVVLILGAAPNAVVPMDEDLNSGAAQTDALRNSVADQMLRAVRKDAVLILDEAPNAVVRKAKVPIGVAQGRPISGPMEFARRFNPNPANRLPGLKSQMTVVLLHPRLRNPQWTPLAIDTAPFSLHYPLFP